MQTSTRRLFISTLAAFFCLPLRADAADESASPPQDVSVRHVDAKQAEKLVTDRKVVVLDIRTPGEFKTGHISGATNINFHSADFERVIGSLAKTNSYLVHCAVGGRSTQSLKIFQKYQFQSIYHLDGGIKSWEKAGLPVEK